jgi:hypothetical protein
MSRDISRSLTSLVNDLIVVSSQESVFKYGLQIGTRLVSRSIPSDEECRGLLLFHKAKGTEKPPCSALVTFYRTAMFGDPSKIGSIHAQERIRVVFSELYRDCSFRRQLVGFRTIGKRMS